MLLFDRREGEGFTVAGVVDIQVTSVRKTGKVKIAVDAPKHIPVMRDNARMKRDAARFDGLVVHCVDDDPEYAKIVSDALRLLGVPDVCIHHSSMEAIEALCELSSAKAKAETGAAPVVENGVRPDALIESKDVALVPGATAADARVDATRGPPPELPPGIPAGSRADGQTDAPPDAPGEGTAPAATRDDAGGTETKHETHLFLVDYHMGGPEQTTAGSTLVSWLRAHPDLRRAPVLMLSGSEAPAVIEQSLEAGANAFLRKPIEFSELVATLERMLSFWGAAERVG